MIKITNSIINDSKFKAAKYIVTKLRENNHKAFIVGGAVRDLCLNLEPNEFDISTCAKPEEIQKIFKKTKPVGQSFGVMLVIVDNVSFEIATFREDMEYADGRHPTDVVYTQSEEEDIRRRDFTINGLMLDPDTLEIFDFCNGLDDLKSKTIRTIGNPKERFSEDHLRILRAIRFANRFGFKIELETERELVLQAPEITKVSAERIREELTKIITNRNSGKGVHMLSSYGLIQNIIPEIELLKGVEQPKEFHPEGDVFVHTCLVLDMLEKEVEENATLAFGALFHDIGKPSTFTETDRIRFNRHEYVGANMTDKICKRLKFSNKQSNEIKSLVSEHMKFGNVKDMKKSTFKRFISIDNFDLHLKLHKADCLASHGDLSLYDFTVNKIEELSNEPIKPKPIINGDDLISLGLNPGPEFKDILSQIFDEQLEGNLKTKEDGMALAKSFIKEVKNEIN